MGLREFTRRIFYPPSITPLPWRIIFILMTICTFHDMDITMVFSFAPKMIKKFGIAEVNTGFYAGWLASSMYVGYLCCSLTWSYLGDRKGKKLSMMISASLLAIFILAFGFSTTFIWALTTRFLQGCSFGLFNVSKSYLYERLDDTNTALAMAVITSTGTVGLILGPSVAGYLVFPTEQYPTVFSNKSIFHTFPVLLPHLVVSGGLAIGVILAIIFLPNGVRRTKTSNSDQCISYSNTNVEIEENEKVEINKDKRNVEIGGNKEVDIEETNKKLKTKSDNKGKNLEINIKESNEKDVNPNSFSQFDQDVIEIDNSVTQTSDNNVQINSTEKHKDHEDLENSIPQNIGKQPPNEKESPQSQNKCKQSTNEHLLSKICQITKTRNCILSCSFYGALGFTSIAANELFSLFASTVKRYKGMGLSTSEIGTILMIPSIGLIILQIPVLTKVCSLLGARKFFIYSAYLQAVMLPLLPVIAMIQNKTISWTLLCLHTFLLRMLVSGSFLTVTILINNSSPPSLNATANGIGFTFTAIGRLLAPSIFGAIYSWSLTNVSNVARNGDALGFPFNHYFSFIVLSVFTMILGIVGNLVTKDADYKLKDVESK